MYRSEMEARLAFLAKAARYAGIKEGSAEHKVLIAAYNAETDGYDMGVDDPWCAMFLSAIAAMLGYQRMPLECSCSRMVAKAKSMGIRVENRGYRPQVGDWPVYDLDLNGAMDHIGVAIDVDGDDVYVLEGNFGDTVKSRFRIRYDDPRIQLWICPDYTERVERATAASGGSSAAETFADVPADAWYAGAVHKARELGIVEGVGGGLFEPDRAVTRAEAAAMMVRLVEILK